MSIRSEIVLVITVSLVPFLYFASSVPDACAAPKEEGWGGTSCSLSSDEKYKSCCWHEPDGDQVCQTCEVDGTNCDAPIVEKGSNGIPRGEVLQEPTIDPGLKAGDFPPSQVNGLTNNSNGTLARDYIKEPGKIEFPNLDILPNTTKSEKGKELDENEPTIKDDDVQTGPQENASTTEMEQKEPLTTFLEKNLNNAKDLPSQLKMVKQVKDPYKKLVLLTGIMEEQGKVPAETTKALNSVLQGDVNALDELCNIISTDQGTNIAADICTTFPEQSDNVKASMIEYALLAFLISIQEILLE